MQLTCAECDSEDAPLYPFGPVHLCSDCLNRKHHIAKEIAVAKDEIVYTLTKPPGQPELFPLLPALAKRLGIEPIKPGETSPGRVLLTMSDGTSYDLFAIVNAVLDRIDGVST